MVEVDGAVFKFAEGRKNLPLARVKSGADGSAVPLTAFGLNVVFAEESRAARVPDEAIGLDARAAVKKRGNFADLLIKDEHVTGRALRGQIFQRLIDGRCAGLDDLRGTDDAVA